MNAFPKQWCRWIHLAEYWYNTSWHSALSHSPFEVLYVHLPRSLGISPADACPMPALQEWLHERSLMKDLIKQHLARAQERMKSQTDKKRSERTFEIGESVYLKLQPYIQTYMAPRANQK